MISRREFLIFSMAATAAAAMGGCSSKSDQGDSKTTETAAPETQVIVDEEGTEVEIPYDLDNVAITSWKGAIGAFVVLGQKDRIKVCCDCSRYRWLTSVMPDLLTLPNYGSFNDVNFEEMVKANPDVVISPVAAADANKKMRELGLKVAVDGSTPSVSGVFAEREAELKMCAEMTHSKDILDKYNEWNNGLVELVEKRVADIPESERKSVLPVRTTIEEVFCENISLGLTMKMAGGKLVTEGMNEYYTQVDSEQIVKWNPDVIIQQIVTIDQDAMHTFYTQWSQDERYKDLTAVKNGDVYIMPMGITQWTGDIETGLGMLLMGKLLYPEKFTDLDLLAYTQDFYKTFLGIDLTDKDYKGLFIDMDGAKSERAAIGLS